MDRITLIENKRNDFRNIYSGLIFNSYLNIALVLALFIISLLYSGAKLNWTVNTILLLPLALLYSDGALYLAHRFQQHKKIKYQERVFEMHSVWHHGMFSNERMNVDSLRDMNMVVLPFFVHGFVIGLIYLPLSILLERLFESNIGYLLMFSVTLHLLWYEVVHTVSHLKNPPVLKTLAKHHKEHHNPKYMGKYNFGIATTIFDRIFRTHLSS